jgi:hypothetical protein
MNTNFANNSQPSVTGGGDRGWQGITAYNDAIIRPHYCGTRVVHSVMGSGAARRRTSFDFSSK